MRILIVEDEDAIREMLVMVLDQANFASIAATDAEEAQKFWPVYNAYSKESSQARKDNKEDIIVMDEMLLNIKKKYTGEFKKILGTDQRANKVFVSERNFGNVIRKEMENRQKLRQQQRLEVLPNK